MSEALNAILKSVIILGIAIFLTVIVPAVTKLIASKTHNQKINTMLTEINKATAVTVKMLEQTQVIPAKEYDEWDNETKCQVCNQAISSIIDSLSDSTKQLIEQMDIELKDYIEKYVESYIYSIKK